jgi:hypothetical protein
MKFFITLLLICMSVSQDLHKELDPFTKIKLNVPAETKIVLGDKFSIKIEGRKKDIDDIEIDVYRNTLEVDKKNRNMFNFWGNDSKDMQITITTKSLEGLRLNASGKLRVEDVESKDFELSIHGSTDVFLSGKMEFLNISIKGSGDLTLRDVRGKEMSINISGSGDIDASGEYNILDIDIKGSGDIDGFDLQVNEVLASIYGSGNIKIAVSELIEASIYGSGDVLYKGNPKKIRDKVYGSGSVERY